MTGKLRIMTLAEGEKATLGNGRGDKIRLVDERLDLRRVLGVPRGEDLERQALAGEA